MIGTVGSEFNPMQMMQQMREMRNQMHEKLKAADTDGTKGLSKDELTSLSDQLKAEGKEETPFLDKLQENFDKLDSNSDGQLTKDEVRAGAKAAGIHPPGGPGGAKPQGGELDSLLGGSSEEETVFAQEGENISPVTVDENGNVVFRTVIKLDSSNSDFRDFFSKQLQSAYKAAS